MKTAIFIAILIFFVQYVNIYVNSNDSSYLSDIIVNIRNDGSVITELTFRFENVTAVEQLFSLVPNAYEIGFKLYRNGSVYLMLEHVEEEQIVDVIGWLNGSLLSIRGYSVEKVGSLLTWIVGSCVFQTSSEKIEAFVSEADDAFFQEVFSVECDCIMVRLFPANELTVTLIYYDDLRRFQRNDAYSFAVSSLRPFCNISDAKVISPVSVNFISLRNLSILEVSPSGCAERWDFDGYTRYRYVIEWQKVDVHEVRVEFKADLSGYPLLYGAEEDIGIYAKVGDFCWWAVRLTNGGTKKAINITIRTYLPENTTMVVEPVRVVHWRLVEVVGTTRLWKVVKDYTVEPELSDGGMVFRIPELMPNDEVKIFPIKVTADEPLVTYIPHASVSYEDDYGHTYHLEVRPVGEGMIEFYKGGSHFAYTSVIIGTVIIVAVWVSCELMLRKRRLRRGR